MNIKLYFSLPIFVHIRIPEKWCNGGILDNAKIFILEKCQGPTPCSWLTFSYVGTSIINLCIVKKKERVRVFKIYQISLWEYNT